MIRRHFTFDCEGSVLVATLDRAQGPDGSAHDSADTGLLIISGGNEVRSGAWNGQSAALARSSSFHSGRRAVKPQRSSLHSTVMADAAPSART